jgi:hypothetical protein
MEYVIEDARDASFFKKTTFSKYELSAVKKELMKSLVDGKLEQSCYWSTELVCSGHFIELWELVFAFFGKYVHVGNPKLPIYLELRLRAFVQVAQAEPVELNLRNELIVRKLVAEMMCVLALSPKRHGVEVIKVRRDELDLSNQHDRLKAPDVKFAGKAFKPGDPKELFVPLNELAFALHSNRTVDACYWLEWVMEFESAKKTIRCAPREYVQGKKAAADLIWMCWDVMMAQIRKRGPVAEKIAASTLALFTMHYTTATSERRRFLMYFVVAMCCDPVETEVEIVPDKKIIEAVFPKCNLMYKDILRCAIKLKA